MAHCLGFRERFSEPVTPGTRFQGRRQNSSFSRFLAVFVGYSTLLGFRGQFSEPVTPGTRFQGRRQNSTFSCFLAIFVGYSTLFRVLGTISKPVTPSTRLHGRRQNSSLSRFLAVFVGYSSLFILETISVPVTPVHGYTGDVKTRRIRVFWVFSWASILFRVPGTIFGARDPRYTVSGATSKLVVFAFSGRFRGL